MIKDALESAKDQTLDHSLYEVIVLDQSNNDETKMILENYPKFIYKKLNSKGLTLSRNESITYAEGDILVYVDDDAYFKTDYLENILAFFDNSPLKPDFIGGKTYIDYLTPPPKWLKGKLEMSLAHSDYGEQAIKYDVHPKKTPYGCNMAIKKQVLLDIGGFKNYARAFSPYLPENEDVILGIEVKKKNYNVIYNPTMLVYHKMPASRLTYPYFKTKYNKQGQSDCFIYYMLGHFSKKKILSLLVKQLYRALEGPLKSFFENNISEKYYQKLRFHYNLGYSCMLLKLFNANKQAKTF